MWASSVLLPNRNPLLHAGADPTLLDQAVYKLQSKALGVQSSETQGTRSLKPGHSNPRLKPEEEAKMMRAFQMGQGGGCMWGLSTSPQCCQWEAPHGLQDRCVGPSGSVEIRRAHLSLVSTSVLHQLFCIVLLPKKWCCVYLRGLQHDAMGTFIYWKGYQKWTNQFLSGWHLLWLYSGTRSS